MNNLRATVFVEHRLLKSVVIKPFMLALMLMSFALVIPFSAKAGDNDSPKCNELRHKIVGLYSGELEISPGNSEPITLTLQSEGIFTLVSRLEYPYLFPGVSDLESAFIGAWKSNCDGTYRLAGIQKRQAVDGGGLPGLVGYTSAEIPSLPNYTFVLAGDFAVSKTGAIEFTNVNFAFGDNTYTVDTGVLLPFTSLLPPMHLTLQRQGVDALYNAIPK